MSRLNVAFNGRFLSLAHPAGTHRSAKSFFLALVEANKGRFTIDLHGPTDLPDNLSKKKGFDHTPIRQKKIWAWHIWEQLCWPANQCHLAINPINTSPVAGSSNHVVFIHDLNLLRHYRTYRLPYLIWNVWATVLAATYAQHIVCFSETVREDIHRWLSVSRAKITVLPQGPGLEPSALCNTEVLPPGAPYFLCVGSLQPHKNLSRVLAAWEMSGLSARGYELRIVGKPQANFRSETEPDASPIAGVVYTGYVTDAKLASLYRGAIAFLYPSLDEGFGLPIIEAFNLGCPVVTSNRSCLPEISGGAALLVDPTDISELCDAVRKLAGSEALRSKLIESGYERAQKFTWTKAGDELVALLENLSNERDVI